MQNSMSVPVLSVSTSAVPPNISEGYELYYQEIKHGKIPSDMGIYICIYLYAHDVTV